MSPAAAMLLSPFRPAAALAAIRRDAVRAEPPWPVAAAFYAVGTSAYAALPLLSPNRPASAGEAALSVGLLAFMLAVTNLFYAIAVELALDPRMKRGRARALLHRTLCTSGAFGLTAAGAVAGAVALGGGLRAAAALLAATVWWQWMVEALTLRELYERSYPAAFGVEAAARALSTLVGGLAGYALVGQVQRLIDFGLGV